MRIYRNDIIKASAISTGNDRGLLPVFNNRFRLYVYSERDIGR